MIEIKRVYDTQSDKDGFRVLVDRLWPRGLSKKSSKIDLWLKDIAPSDGLRKWFAHDPKKWPDFKKRYGKEMEEKTQITSELESLERKKRKITLLYAAKDRVHNNAAFLREYLQKHGPSLPPQGSSTVPSNFGCDRKKEKAKGRVS